jgi:DNA repair exonuclease SbcCD ATPase subunit
MKIKLENFGVYQGVHNIDMDTPISIFIGMNGTGKTTIADAIRFALSGRVNGAKKENVSILHNGSKYAEVEIVFDDGFAVKRRLTAAGGESISVGSVTDDTPASVKQTVIWNYLNLTEREFPFFSRVNFLDMNSEERKKFLGEYLQLSLNKDTLVERVKKEVGDDFGTVKEEVEGTIDIALKEGIKEAENYSVNTRRVLKRERDKLTPLPVVDFIEIEGNKVDLKPLKLPDIEKKLETRKNERDELLKEKGRAEIVRGRDLYKEHGEVAAKIAELKEKISTLKYEESKKSATDLGVKKAQLEKELTHIKGLGKEVAMVDVCPAYNAKCPITEKQFKKIKELVSQPAEDAHLREKAISDEMSHIVTKINEHNSAITDYDNTKALLKEEEAKLLEIKKYIDSGIRPFNEVEKSLTQAETLLRNCEKVHTSLKEYQKAVSHNAGIDNRIKQAEREIEIFDRLAKLFSPEGNLLTSSEKIKGVNDTLESLKGFIGYPVRVTEILEIEGMPVRVSRAEEYIVNIALLIALNPVVKFIVVDNADMFDTLHKEMMFKKIFGEMFRNFKVIVLAVQQNGVVKPSPFSNIKVFHVNGGVKPVLKEEV